MLTTANTQIARNDGHADAVAGALLRTFFNIADRWQLSVEEQAVLLDTSKATLYRLRQRSAAAGGGGEVTGISTTMRERLEIIWDIFKGVREFFANNRPYADQWIREYNTNPLFGGQSALDRMLSGKTIDLYRVRDHVQGMLGLAGW